MPQSLKEKRQALVDDSSIAGSQFCDHFTDAADEWLSALFERVTEGDTRGLALMAIGGYGRREMCPASDLDLFLVHSSRRKRVDQIAQEIWYPIWDQGIKLDHSVRTLKEALAVAKDDMKAALGLLDARYVAGDRTLADEVAPAAQDQWRKLARSGLAELAESVADRHRERGDVAFLLEPDIKDDRGGLRDFQALFAASVATDSVSSPLRDAELSGANRSLLGIRVELQRITGKDSNQLLLQDQDRVATSLGYADADALMVAVVSSARAIAWASDHAWHRIGKWLENPRPSKRPKSAPLGKSLVLVDGEIGLAPEAKPSEEPALAFWAATAAAELGTVVSDECLSSIASASPEIPEPWPDSLRNAFVSLLGTGHQAIHALETLDHAGILARLIPEWPRVRNLPQRNAFHRFTVDRHLCEAAAQASLLVRRVSRPDLLLVGALLHDIGKGFPGDHTIAGIDVVGRIGMRMGFAEEDIETLVQMVRLHLVVPEAATRRDLDDPATIDFVAEAVRDTDTLELLSALTEADSIATGPTAWTPWRASLIAKLVDLTSKKLSGQPTENQERELGPEMIGLAESVANRDQGLEIIHHPHLDGTGWALTVIAHDRQGLLSLVTGVLALHNLAVLSAQVAPVPNSPAAIEEFVVLSIFDKEPPWSRLKEDLGKVLKGELDLDSKLEEKARAYAGQRRPGAAKPAEPRVIFHNEASQRATVIEVRAPDGVGVLNAITSALAESGLDITSAMASTLGHEVVDVFYVTNSNGLKVTDSNHLDEIHRRVISSLEKLANANPRP